MSESRRLWMSRMAGVVAVPLFGAIFASGQRPSPQPIPSPHAPDPHFPPGLDGPDLSPDSSRRTINPEKQGAVREEVSKLYQLATELKQQVDKTDVSNLLSVGVLKKAQEIEKLAKHIKQLSKG